MTALKLLAQALASLKEVDLKENRPKKWEKQDGNPLTRPAADSGLELSDDEPLVFFALPNYWERFYTLFRMAEAAVNKAKIARGNRVAKIMSNLFLTAGRELEDKASDGDWTEKAVFDVFHKHFNEARLGERAEDEHIPIEQQLAFQWFWKNLLIQVAQQELHLPEGIDSIDELELEVYRHNFGDDSDHDLLGKRWIVAPTGERTTAGLVSIAKQVGFDDHDDDLLWLGDILPLDLGN